MTGQGGSALQKSAEAPCIDFLHCDAPDAALRMVYFNERSQTIVNGMTWRIRALFLHLQYASSPVGPCNKGCQHVLCRRCIASQRIFQMWCGTADLFLAHYSHLRTGFPTALTCACTTMGMGAHRQSLMLCPVQTTS